MTNDTERLVVYIVSDSVGETAELVVKAAVSQFSGSNVELRRIPYVEDKGTIQEVVQIARKAKALIAFTLVVPEIRDFLLESAKAANVETVDIIGPVLSKITDLTNAKPRYEPGLIYRLDEDYFRKVEAIEFAVKYDDGRDPRGIILADIVLIGVSRTSKTPLSQYLAHKRLKVANVPLVPEVEPPEELFKISSKKCIGLKISPEKLNSIRTERLKALGLKSEANYANIDRIKEELEYAKKVMDRVNCPVIDVSNKAVEETANLISSMFQRN
ncbi:pyruvate, water dikinase regulatory protein [Shouchella clausii]|jgi:[pyruvate, water dikinase]-phosphate phosphotransferase / [pyruvate, water dikinase] kinase|uniref:Putative pyruvate, phosphate dikinase regulatory protein n=3 Tax=Shouchella TaxID=2893057 RepID=PDRP_SHOC1|nr:MULTISPECIES: pyruvate, water dikinase regulatory protein [Shouchella]Q5WHD3.1 RecName: Full=Putative pyruvate, phosphate dikinase regulatory protein; Short=PPDK regulatory protein [Shouchella clausii KSM-K16]MCM3312457.1 kinase/pyrophosphorylase [Psychrobacillus sp. MER TA 17]PAD43593.1 phosphoenolpyruvate synthase regulatory protein [Bacillus sp. 7520-S]SPU22020.1 PEP synthetase regulatory protein [Niallia circulans]ALA51145.1 ATP/GTP-binding protein [Shouchella clausii]AST98084.1 phosph